MPQLIKVGYVGRQNTTQLKLVEVEINISFENLLSLLNESFRNSHRCSLFWKDEDGDEISVNNTNDLGLFFRQSKPPFKLLYTYQDTVAPTQPIQRLPPPIPIRTVPTNTLSTISTNLLNLPPPVRQTNVHTIALPRLNARFVRHVTCDDESSYYAPGQQFFKTWKFRNDGTLAWPTLIHILFVSKLTGDQLGGPESLEIPFPAQIKIGTEEDISVPLLAPEKPGEYTGFWKLSDEHGKKFGQRVRVRINVCEPIPDALMESFQHRLLNEAIENGYEHARETIKCILRKQPLLTSYDHLEKKLNILGIRMKV
jgi:Ig-like domain from next to BRCA1 gene/PB1 domain